MTELKETKQVINGVSSHFIVTDKFKTVTVYLQFKAPLNRETVTQRALLSYILRGSTSDFPTTQSLSKYLDELYGAALASGVSKRGADHVLTVSLTVANDRFIKSESGLLQKSLSLLGSFFFEPNVVDDGFDPHIVKREKRALKRRIESIYDDKMRYANQRLIDEMCKDEDYSIHASGYIDEIDKISEKELLAAFRHLIDHDAIDLYVVGDFNTDQMKQDIEQHLSFSERNAGQSSTDEVKRVHPKRELKEVTEEQDIEQGKLHIGYRVPIVYGDPDYPASQVFNGLFGGFPHSKLFMNVREKASLAYYASSRYESFKGLMIVVSGIDSKDKDQAVQIIDEQLLAMQKGEFTEEDILKTKALLKNAFLESMDQPYGLIDWFSEYRLPHDHSLDSWIEAIDDVSAEDLIKVAHQVNCDTIYFLKGKGEA